MPIFLNRIATAVPPHDIHARYVAFAPAMMRDERQRRLFHRMAARAQIERRYSVLSAGKTDDAMDGEGYYSRSRFPGTAARMALYERHAFPLLQTALDRLGLTQPEIAAGITHVIVTSCTGYYAPGLDLEIIARYGLSPATERSTLGFLGCHAAVNALKAARHIVRSDPVARVLVVNVELCTLHLQESDDLESLLAFLLFADGAAAAIVSAQEEGLELLDFHSFLLPESASQITWRIGDSGFDMRLGGEVPATIGRHLPALLPSLLGGPAKNIRHWAVHPGGRSILDAMEHAAMLPPDALAIPRRVLRDCGNMSSATLMFVLKEMLENGAPGPGCAMAFGPGVMLESFRFAKHAP